MEDTIKSRLEEMFSCDNCGYIRFDPEDTEEKKQCSAMGRFNELPLNCGIIFLMDKYNIKNICEYWQAREARK